MLHIAGIIGFIITVLGLLVVSAETGQGKVADHRLDFIEMGSFVAGIVLVICYIRERPAAGWSGC